MNGTCLCAGCSYPTVAPHSDRGDSRITLLGIKRANFFLKIMMRQRDPNNYDIINYNDNFPVTYLK
jgi:hypothetical protein